MDRKNQLALSAGGTERPTRDMKLEAVLRVADMLYAQSEDFCIAFAEALPDSFADSRRELLHICTDQEAS